MKQPHRVIPFKQKKHGCNLRRSAYCDSKCKKWMVGPSFRDAGLLKVVCYTAEPASPHMGWFWTSLGVEAACVEELCELQLRFCGSRLWLHEDVQQLDDWVDRVTTCLMHLWKFADFRASGYGGSANASRSLCRGLASGIDSLVR